MVIGPITIRPSSVLKRCSMVPFPLVLTQHLAFPRLAPISSPVSGSVYLGSRSGGCCASGANGVAGSRADLIGDSSLQLGWLLPPCAEYRKWTCTIDSRSGVPCSRTGHPPEQRVQTSSGSGRG